MTDGRAPAGHVDGTPADTMATPAHPYGARHTRNPENADPAECPAAYIRSASMHSSLLEVGHEGRAGTP